MYTIEKKMENKFKWILKGGRFNWRTNTKYKYIKNYAKININKKINSL